MYSPKRHEPDTAIKVRMEEVEGGGWGGEVRVEGQGTRSSCECNCVHVLDAPRHEQEAGQDGDGRDKGGD